MTSVLLLLLILCRPYFLDLFFIFPVLLLPAGGLTKKQKRNPLKYLKNVFAPESNQTTGRLDAHTDRFGTKGPKVRLFGLDHGPTGGFTRFIFGSRQTERSKTLEQMRSEKRYEAQRYPYNHVSSASHCLGS